MDDEFAFYLEAIDAVDHVGYSTLEREDQVQYLVHVHEEDYTPHVERQILDRAVSHSAGNLDHHIAASAKKGPSFVVVVAPIAFGPLDVQVKWRDG